MKNTVHILLILFTTLVYSQPSSSEVVESLKSIKSQNDFAQKSLSNEEIDSVISGLISLQVRNKIKNGKIEIPFNHKKIKYLGFIHPNEIGLFKANPINKEKHTEELDTTLYIYKYGDFYISTESHSKKSLLNVYHTLRGINITKTRYPEIFEKLFINTMSFATEKPAYADWVNSNKAFWIAFNENPNYLATNNTIFLGEGYFANSKVGKYRNVSLVNIDSENILGESKTLGSRPMYNLETNDDNHLAYLKDGLIESICHEMLHNYIDLAYTYDEVINNIRSNRTKPNFKYAEENAILNTSLPYFKNKGGLDDNVIQYYYKNTFDVNIKTLKDSNLLNDYATIFSDEFEGKEWEDIFKLMIFEN
tara:strand:+ start:2131 stop:3222 length:1092 start_codon:yes stop_codon:yes gene_type:complete